MMNKEKGHIGENMALDYLVYKGYKIVYKNYANNYGEVDIICEKDEFLIFVEVKSRTDLCYGYPYESVDEHKQGQIIGTAYIYIMEKKIKDKQIRFDIVEVYLNENRINHIENAFSA